MMQIDRMTANTGADFVPRLPKRLNGDRGSVSHDAVQFDERQQKRGKHPKEQAKRETQHESGAEESAQTRSTSRSLDIVV